MILLSVFLLFTGCLQAQATFQYGMMPALNFNKKINQRLKINFKTEGRQRLYQDGSSIANYELTDFSLLLARRTSLDHTLAGGYLIRFRGGARIHRFIQQWAFADNYTNLGLVHRFVFDQTFVPSEAAEFRLRYRASIELPLSGQSLNDRELYLKVNNEYLAALQGMDYDLEIRLVTALGFRITNDNKVELGLDNRFDSFLLDEGRLRSWTSISWYRSF